MKQFPIHGALHPLESVQGFALRISEANGYDRPPCTGIEMVAEGTEPSGPARRCEQLSPAMRVDGGARICPDCLDELSFARLHWTIKPYAVCHIHRRRLIDTCPGCQKPLSWRRRALAQCRCGAALASTSGAIATSRQLIVPTLLSEALVSGVTGPSAVVPGLDLATTASLSWFLGVSPESPKWRSAYLAKPTGYELEDNADRAAEFLPDWPVSFDRWLLEQMRAGGERQLYLSLRRARTAIPGYANQLMERARAFLELGIPTVPLRKDALFATRRSWIIAAEAAGELGVTNATVASWVDSGDLEARTVTRAQRTIRLIDRRSLDALKIRLAGEVSAREAELLLNISRGQLNRLRRAGLAQARRRGSRWRYEISSLCLIVKELADVANSQSAEATISIVNAGRNWRMPLEHLLKEALAGRLAVFRDGASEDAGLAVFRILRPRQPGIEPQGLTFKEAASELKFSQRMIRVLVDANCLLELRGGARPTIDRSSAALFYDRFITSREIAEAAGSNTRTVIALLLKDGIKPCVTGSTVKGISYVWNRSQKITALIAAPKNRI